MYGSEPTEVSLNRFLAADNDSVGYALEYAPHATVLPVVRRPEPEDAARTVWNRLVRMHIKPLVRSTSVDHFNRQLEEHFSGICTKIDAMKEFLASKADIEDPAGTHDTFAWLEVTARRHGSERWASAVQRAANDQRLLARTIEPIVGRRPASQREREYLRRLTTCARLFDIGIGCLLALANHDVIPTPIGQEGTLSLIQMPYRQGYQIAREVRSMLELPHRCAGLPAIAELDAVLANIDDALNETVRTTWA